MIDDKAAFQTLVWDFYNQRGRHDLPWRLLPADGSAAYQIMVSELMLQQTQVSRVIPKYQQFLTTFPSVRNLAGAPLGEVLRVWSGLGYNRRAKFLWQAAGQIVQDYQGELPASADELKKLPGLGANTAGAILAYAYNQPDIFVETNIRTVFIHHFFNDKTGIVDKTILKLVTETLDHEHPREWYWALMDYGAYLKQTVGNPSRQSKSCARQSKFAGSRRQIRGQVIRLLGDQPYSITDLQAQIPDPCLDEVIKELLAEELIHHRGHRYEL